MAAGRNFLFVPGPTNVPERVMRAMVVSMEDHRSPIFPELARACLNGLKPIFKTTHRHAFIFPSSGTGCWEAALTNCLNVGDKVLASRFGQFSHLWIDMCQRLGYEVEILETPGVKGRRWSAISPRSRPTSSTRSRRCWFARTRRRPASPVMSLPCAQAMDSVKHPALLFVDSVSALASIDFAWTSGASTCASAARRRA